MIEREIGQGGMGVVYQALDLERNTLVALKALTQRDAINIYRLKNEFRQLADLSHPNLVTLHELCSEGGAWFFTMELVQGKTFDRYVANEHFSGDRASDAPAGRDQRVTAAGWVPREASITLSQGVIGSEFPLPRLTCNVRRLRHALRQLVEAIAALHDAGKLHRDIKPSNVLVTESGRVVVLDFGLVCNGTLLEPEAQDAERTVGGCLFGTPAYMSPEQAAGEAIGTPSDWYSVGVMLYEALTGQLPFDGSVIEILRQKDELEPIPPSELVKGVPDDLDQLCRELLRRDPDRRPRGSEILRYLTGHSAPPPVFDAQSSSLIRKHGELFIGRETHLAELRAAFEQARGGRPTTVLVHGFSGMGKSALVRCFANDLIRNDEAVVLRGRCYERETVPYKAFDNIIDALSRYMMRLPAEEAAELLPRNVHALALLFPVLKRVKAISQARRPKHQTSDPRELRNQAFAALKDLLLRISDFHPLVINIDDLQWADMDSARLLGFLLGPPDPPPLLLVGAYRRDEAENSPFLRYVVGEHGLGEGGAELREMRLDALAAEEAEHLASALLRDMPGESRLLAQAIAAEADGVPFFIAELVQHVKARSDAGEGLSASGPISLEQVIMARVSGMPEPAQRLLRVLSVAAAPLEQGIAIEAAGLPSGDRAATLALRAARLIRTRGTRQTDTAETYHDRVRETVVRHLRDAAVRDIHARIARAMERLDLADPERLVVHYSGAGEGMRAGETAIQAAHAAAKKLAFNRAAELFKRAIELAPADDDAHVRGLQRHLGDALANAGRGAQAAEAYLKAAEGLAGEEARKLERMAAQQYLRSGRVEEGMPLAVRMLAQVGVAYPSSSARSITQLLLERARLAIARPIRRPKHDVLSSSSIDRLDVMAAVYKEVFALDPLRGTLLQTRYLREAYAIGDPARLTQGVAWEAINTAFAAGTSKRARVESLLADAARMAHELHEPYASATVDMARAACAVSLGQFDGAEALAKRAEESFQSECTGASWEVTIARTWRYTAAELAGDLASFWREAPGYRRDAEERGDDFALSFLTIIVPFAHLIRDDVNGALRYLERQESRLQGDFSTHHLWVMDRTLDCFLYDSQYQRAWQYLESFWPAFQRSFLSRTALLRVNAHFLLGRTAVSAVSAPGDERRVAAVREAIKVLRTYRRPDAQVYAGLIEAGLANRCGDPERARSELEQTVAICERSGINNFAHYAKRNLGRVLGHEAGRQMASEAESCLSAMGVVSPDRWIAAYAPGFD